MILITGATGHLGKATIDHLLSKGADKSTISALVRDEAKAAPLKDLGIKLLKGDFNDYQSLVLAFEGIDTLFFVSSSDILNRQVQHENVVNAAKKAGIGRIIFTSVTRKREDGSSAIAFLLSSMLSTEKMIKEGGFDYTILKNPLYADVLPMFLGYDVLDTGVFLPAGEGKASFTLREDLAEASAAVLLGGGHDGKEYLLASEENLSFSDVAAVLSQISERPVPYQSPSADLYRQTLIQAGVPEEQIGGLSMFLEAINQGEFETEHTDLPFLLGRRPTTLKSFLASVYAGK
ncbi:Quinone oxidoreductase 2 [compost metagenome]